MSAALSLGPSAPRKDSSNRPTAAHCFWTRSATWGWNCKRGCSGSWRNGPCGVWAHQERTHRIGRRRHTVSGRDRRRGGGTANAAVPVRGGTGPAASGRTVDGARGLPDRVCDQPGSCGQNQGGNLSRRTLLPVERSHGQAAGSAREAGGYPPYGALFSGTVLPTLRQKPLGFSAILRGAFEGTLARQPAPT